MLDLAPTKQLIDDAWANLPSRTELIGEEEDFFAVDGAAPTHGESRRQYHRFYLRTRAILNYEGQSHAIFVMDGSRKGIGLLSPVQLFPRDAAVVTLTAELKLQLSVRRCRRLGPRCYHCGMVFAKGLAAPAEFKLMIQRRRRQPE